MGAFQRVRAGVRAYMDQLRILRRSLTRQVTGTVRTTRDGVVRTFHAWKPTVTHVAKRALLVYAAMVFFLVVLCCTALACTALAAVSAGSLRYLLVVNAPGNQMHTLDVNVMPLFTEPWRLSTVQDEVTHFSIHPTAALYATDTNDSTSVVPRASPAMEYLETEAAKMRLTFLSQYAQSIIATSTFLIPPAAPRGVFSKDGVVDVDSLFFHPVPMFNGKGTYSAQLQLVFAREERGRDVSVVVESQVLYAKDAHKPQSLRSLDVLFTKTHSSTVRTGAAPQPLLVEAVRWVLGLWFYVPMRLYSIAHYYLLESKEGMTFPPILSEREVAVSLDLYSQFAPPAALQPRLRAVNFTVYQLLDASGERLKLSRIHLFSMVQLSGLAYWLVEYPLTSFVLLSGAFFVLYMGSACLLLLFGSLFLYVRLFSSDKESTVLAKRIAGMKKSASDQDWESSSESGEPHTRAAVRSHAGDRRQKRAPH